MGLGNLNSGLILPLERLVTLVVPHPEMAGLPSQPHGDFLVWVTFVALQARIEHNCNPPTCGPGAVEAVRHGLGPFNFAAPTGGFPSFLCSFYFMQKPRFILPG